MSTIRPYNAGRVGIYDDEYVSIETLTASSVYEAFKSNLVSSRLGMKFFEEVYVPSLDAEQQQINSDILYKKFAQILSVKQADPKGEPERYRVTFNHGVAATAAEWVERYINLAIQQTKNELREQIDSEQGAQLTALQARLDSALEIAESERTFQIMQLKEGLFVAEAIGLEYPSEQSDKASFGGNRFIDNDLIYTRGAKTLRAQLTVLQNRKNPEAFVQEYAKMKEYTKLLTNYSLDDSRAEVVVIDSLAEPPSTLIKPKKTMIVAVGVVLGGMLGLFAALLRSAIRKRMQPAQ